jgi:hypothetical protein
MSDPGVLVTPDDIKERMPVVLDYTSRDFSAIRAQLIGLARGFMPEWETAGEASDFGTLLLELFAYMGDVMHFYIDRTASEAFLGTAQRRQSVLYIADQMGYVPIGQQAATVKLLVSISEQVEAPVTLPSHTRVFTESKDSSEDSIIFELDSPVFLDPGDPESETPNPSTDVEVYATEGITVIDTVLGVSQGQPSTDFVLENKGVVYGSVVLRTDEAGKHVVWTYTSDLSLARPTQSQFTTFVDELGWTHIVFGDNASGRIPPVNATVFVTYRYGVGAKANDVLVGAITSIAPPPGVDIAGITLTNPEQPLGGTDPETVESMRYSIPRASGRIKSRAVTLNDYADLAMQVPNVAKSVAHGAIYTAVYVRVAPAGGKANDVYMDKLCTSVEAYLADKVMVGSTVYAEPRRFFDLWRNIFIQMTVHVTAGYNRTVVRNNVETTVREALAFDSVDFGTSVTIGTVYRAALSISGVDWVDLTHLSDEAPAPQTEEEPQKVVLTGDWDHSNSVDVTTAPNVGTMRTNSPAPVTTIALSKTTDRGADVGAEMASIQIGDHVIFRQSTDARRWQTYTVIAPALDKGSWVSLEVAVLDTGPDGVPNRGNVTALLTVMRYEVQEEGVVVNLVTSVEDGTNLLIPQIDPTKLIELEVDYPDLSETERTHDGLWVVAVGGMANT